MRAQRRSGLSLVYGMLQVVRMSDTVLWEYSVDEILKHDDRAGPNVVADVFSSVAYPSSICIELRFTWRAFAPNTNRWALAVRRRDAAISLS